MIHVKFQFFRWLRTCLHNWCLRARMLPLLTEIALCLGFILCSANHRRGRWWSVAEWDDEWGFKSTECRVMGTRETTGAIKQGEGTPASNIYSSLLKNTEEHCCVVIAIDHCLVKLVRQSEIWNILRLEYRLNIFALEKKMVNWK